MARKAVRCIGLALVGAAAFAVLRRWLHRHDGDDAARGDRPDPSGSPPTLTSVPDLRPAPSPGPDPAASGGSGTDANGDSDGRRWSAPVDEACPPGYPVKVNERSGIYHVPGGQSYDRTRPTRCYPDAATAEADGYRQAKR